MFALHPQLAADTHLIADWPLSRVLLMDDRRFPWLILVPRRPQLCEIHDLAPADRAQLMEEIVRASRALSKAWAPDKINVAALGNVVRQLHIHIVGRRKDDAAQPGLVWAAGPAQRYSPAALADVIGRAKAALAD
ncbi:MAG TPA: HIT domain-containing protein [Alphaproteobacteria bacterium]|nr:HIT domain-containing protein [Alphaproteobacteria bacterium]